MNRDILHGYSQWRLKKINLETCDKTEQGSDEKKRIVKVRKMHLENLNFKLYHVMVFLT